MVSSASAWLSPCAGRKLRLRIDPTLAEGVYAGLPGPHYETPAEIRMLRILGADLVGMSTVHETIAARAAGAEVLGVSLVVPGTGTGSSVMAVSMVSPGRPGPKGSSRGWSDPR